MASDDMNHMNHLDAVALSDVAVLQSKEATYQGSWKRAGGRSAWFMARRNMDRLLTMMPAKPVPHAGINSLENIRGTLMGLKQSVHYGFDPMKQTIAPLPGSIEGTMAILDHVLDAYTADDVFARIAEKPRGEDGTVLACIRDLRRYFTLVEAEMIAEGVVQPEVAVGKPYAKGETDIYQMLADEHGLTREQVKERVHRAMYDAKPETPVHRVDITVAGGAKISEKDVVFKGARELSPVADKVYEGGMVHTPAGARRPTEEELAIMGRGGPVLSDRTEAMDGGSHHASLVPWWIERGYYATLAIRVGDELLSKFYVRKTPDVWVLEPVVESEKIPRELKDCYDMFEVDGVKRWVLRRADVPEQLDEQFPRLQIEMNVFEHETSPEVFRFMYAMQGDKMILRPSLMDWGREN